MELSKNKEVKNYTLDADVAKKYTINPAFLNGQKLVFPFPKKHNVANKMAHELKVDEVDKLVAANAVKGVFELKEVPAAAAGSVVVK